MERKEAARLPEGDVVRILLEQHARIRDLFDEVKRAQGEQKKQTFDEQPDRSPALFRV